MKQKTILMLGGSMQQVPAIEAAKEMGYRTVLIDYLSDNPGQFVADKWYQLSTTDVESVYKVAKEECVDGILPYASDPAALPAAIVAERLGLPTNPSKSVEILGVKHKFREFLSHNGFSCPKTFTFSPTDTIDDVIERTKRLKFPIVIKPTDSSGSKGVSFLNDTSQIANALAHADEYSRNKILIAEEFITRGYPDVIGGDVFVENGTIVMFGDMACLRDDGGKSLIPIGKKKPNGLNNTQITNLRAELQRLVNILGIRGGELNIEALIDADDNVHFLEVGPRAGGNMIPIQLSDAYNINLIKANVAVAMGEKASIEISEPTDCFMTFVLHSHYDGILKRIEYSSEIEKYIYRKVHYKKEGDEVEAFDGAGKALGIVFMRFPNIGLMNDFQNSIDNNIKIVLSSDLK